MKQRIVWLIILSALCVSHAHANEERTYWGSPALGEPNVWQSHRMAVEDYAQSLALELVSQLRSQVLEGQVAVTVPTQLHGDVMERRWFGEQYAQALQQQLVRHQLPVVDLKLSQRIRITRFGEVALSRNARELRQEGVQYVVVGQWIARDYGLQLNMRLVRASDQQILASASQIIPEAIFSRSFPTALIWNVDNAQSNI